MPPFAGIAGLGTFRAVIPMVVASGIWYGVLTFLAATLIREVDEIGRFVQGLNRAGVIAGGGIIVLAVVAIIVRRRARRIRPE